MLGVNLVAPWTLGDPMRPLIRVSKSMEKLAAAPTKMGHPIGADTVRKELVRLGFARQSNSKAERQGALDNLRKPRPHEARAGMGHANFPNFLCGVTSMK
jgi:hypothetical protein